MPGDSVTQAGATLVATCTVSNKSTRDLLRSDTAAHLSIILFSFPTTQSIDRAEKCMISTQATRTQWTLTERLGG